MYGNAVTLSNLQILGARPDGSVDIGSDLDFIVNYDTVGAGCDLDLGYCTPGADTDWYLDGQFVGTTIGSGYNPEYGYAVASPPVIINSPGVHTMMAQSGSSTQSIAFSVMSIAESPSAGQVQVTGVTCGTGPDYQCSCESNGQLIVYFTRNVVSPGAGTAYVDVLIDGVQVLTNSPTSTQEGMDSVAVSCPQDGNNHTITVKGKDDAGASVVLYAGTPMGGSFTVSTGSITAGEAENTVYTGGGLGLITNTQTYQEPVSTAGISLGSVIENTKTDNTVIWVAGAAAVVIGGIILAKYLSMSNTGAEDAAVGE